MMFFTFVVILSDEVMPCKLDQQEHLFGVAISKEWVWEEMY